MNLLDKLRGKLQRNRSQPGEATKTDACELCRPTPQTLVTVYAERRYADRTLRAGYLSSFSVLTVHRMFVVCAPRERLPETTTALIDEALKHLEGSLNGAVRQRKRTD